MKALSSLTGSPLENRRGKLFLGGASLRSLADKYGTPLYVTDEDRIRESYRRFRNAFSSNWKRFRASCAVKANCNLAIMNILRQEGAGAYGYSMSSNYNARPRAAEVLVKDREDFLIRESEDITDILDRQRIPGRHLR